MDATAAPTSRARHTAEQADLQALKARQRAAWSSGDYAIVGTTLQVVGEELCEALDVRSGQRVLDVAAGNGNVSLAAARRWCEVVATDYVPELLDRARERAAAERLELAFREADAEALPFPDASFDVVASTFGVMFTPNQEAAASEMARVCADRRAVRRVHDLGHVGAAPLRVSLPFASALAGGLPELLRPAPQDLRGARSCTPGGTRARSDEADRSAQPGERRLHGRSRRIPRNRDRERLTVVVDHPNHTRKDRAMNHAARSITVLRLATLALGAGVTLVSASAPQAAEPHHTVVPADAVTWGPAPPSLPAGAQAAVLLGSPAKEGPFVIRLKFPAGFVVPPHRHSQDELLTVIAGRFGVASGEKLDRAASPPLAPASFVHLPAGMPHFAWVEEETVVQLNGVGPFDVTYIDPKDDPRNK